MKKHARSNGFTTVELLVTLFIAAAFLMSGYQLYDVIMKDGGDARATARASNTIYDYLQRYKTSATNPCTVLNPLTDESITVDSMTDVSVSVAITCPYSTSSPAITTLSKVTVTLKYNRPQQTLSNATYVKP